MVDLEGPFFATYICIHTCMYMILPGPGRAQVDLHSTMLKKLLQTVAPPKIKAQNCRCTRWNQGLKPRSQACMYVDASPDVHLKLIEVHMHD